MFSTPVPGSASNVKYCFLVVAAGAPHSSGVPAHGLFLSGQKGGLMATSGGGVQFWLAVLDVCVESPGDL